MAQLDNAFIERQRQRLLHLRDELKNATPAEREEAELTTQLDEPREPEEEAQRLAALDVDGRLVARELKRRANIERALQKIEQGTYGVSDDSGKAIEKARLEAIPEAVLSVADEEARERREGGPGRG